MSEREPLTIEAEQKASDFMKWSRRQEKKRGGRCPRCMRNSTGKFRERETCPHCGWCETD